MANVQAVRHPRKCEAGRHDWHDGEVVIDALVIPFRWCAKCGTKELGPRQECVHPLSIHHKNGG